jgi:hypothetical protein
MKACYAIIRIGSLDGAEPRISLVSDDTGSHFLSFSSPDEARGWIRQIADRKHAFRQNGTTPTSYAITAVGSGNFRDAYKCTWGAAPERVFATSNRKPSSSAS